jgi:hypothetical protein
MGGEEGMFWGESEGLSPLSSSPDSIALSEKMPLSYGDICGRVSSIDVFRSRLGAGRRDPFEVEPAWRGRGVGARGTCSAETAVLAFKGTGRWRRTEAAVLAVTRSESALGPKAVFFGLFAFVTRALFLGGPSSVSSELAPVADSQYGEGAATSLWKDA